MARSDYDFSLSRDLPYTTPLVSFFPHYNSTVYNLLIYITYLSTILLLKNNFSIGIIVNKDRILPPISII